MSLSTVENTLLIIDLLISRRQVTTKKIMNLCGVSRRTAYRYIEAIHRANIPVYFDRKTNEYRLTHDTLPQYGKFGLQDTALISFALILLSNCTNDSYNLQINKLIKKILTRQSIVFEESLDTQKNMIGSKSIDYDFSDALSSLIIYTAILFKKGIEITHNPAQNDVRTLTIRKPRIMFKDKWQVKDIENIDSNGIFLQEITSAKILNN
jgi:predicted DNA-binding transcriptional regulator YafY